ncbi:MAG: PEP-CTERM sorting domain-containing protein [Verrucomicrobiota bacterium]
MTIPYSLAKAITCAVVATGLLAYPAAAQIVAGNTGGTAGALSVQNQDAGANTSTSFSFNNNGDFIALAVTVGSGTNAQRTFSGGDATVTFGSQTMTFAAEQQRSNDEWAAVFYLPNAVAGTATLSFNFNTNIFSADGGGAPTDIRGAYQIGVISLSNVDTANPIAGIETNSVVGDMTIASQTPGEINSGDFVFTSTVSRTDNADHFATNSFVGDPSSQPTTISNPLPQDGGGGDGSSSSFQSLYQVLVPSDITGDSVILTEFNEGGIAANVGVVFNQVPEPTSGSLLALAAAALLYRRRRAS